MILSIGLQIRQNIASESRRGIEEIGDRAVSTPTGTAVGGCFDHLAGLLVGVGLAFFLKYIDRKVRGVNDIEDFVGLKVIATIPRLMNIPTAITSRT